MNAIYPEIIFVCEDPPAGLLLVNVMRERKPDLVVHMVEPGNTLEWDRIVQRTIEKKKVVFASMNCKTPAKSMSLRNRRFSESIPWMLLLAPEPHHDDPDWTNLPFAKIRFSMNPDRFFEQLAALESFLEICEYP